MKKLLFISSIALFSYAKAQNIGNFISVQPNAQNANFIIPSTHKFQVLIQAGDNLITGGGTMPVNSDFCGYVSQTNNSRLGSICVNSEFGPGKVTILDVKYDSLVGYWDLLNSQNTSFAGVPGGTNVNCGGGISPWKTMVTCEEISYNLDLAGFDGYHDYGWNVEINPFTKAAIDQNNDGTADKIWAMGKFKHENVCFTPDSAIVYEGEDDSANGYLFKYVLSQKAKMGSGTLYALSVTGTTGTWIQIANTTAGNRNGVITSANGTAATKFDRVEDVEVGIDGKIYFTSTADGNIYRFSDNGTSVSNFETFVAAGSYNINYGTGNQNVTFSSCDNLAFDNQGNLWVCQDGGGNFIWMIRPTHTSSNPQIEIFGVTPSGSEPTGIYFTPDGEFMILDIQHPSSGNNATQIDAAGNSITMNADATLIIALNNKWGVSTVGVENKNKKAGFGLKNLYPNPSANRMTMLLHSNKNKQVTIEVYDITGKKLDESKSNIIIGDNNIEFNINSLEEGLYRLRIISDDDIIDGSFVKENE